MSARLLIVFVAGIRIAAQDMPGLPPPDCDALMARPAPGVELLCEGEAAMRRAAAAPDGSPERVQQWRSAARAYTQSVSALQALDHRIYVLEALVDLNGPTHLRHPDGVEQALQGLVQMEPGRPDRALRLAAFQEALERFDAAEETLLFARQVHQDSLDVTRELAKFYARRVLALTPKDESGKKLVAAAPEPAWKPDCSQQTFGAPGPGLGDLCRAMAEMQVGLARPITNPAAAPASPELTRKERLAHLENAAGYFRAALAGLRERQQKAYVYDALVRLYGSANLAEPQQAEAVVRDWISLEPNRVEPILRLSLVQEDLKQHYVAEQTLVGTRQRYPEDLEVMKALSRFYARQASALSTRQSRAEIEKEPVPPPNQPDADGNYRAGSQIAPPRKVNDVRPKFPEEALAVGLEGTVIMEVWLDETGRVTRARMLRGIPMLEDAAVAAVMQWRFEPAIVNGKAVPVRMTITNSFTVQR